MITSTRVRLMVFRYEKQEAIGFVQFLYIIVEALRRSKLHQELPTRLGTENTPIHWIIFVKQGRQKREAGGTLGTTIILRLLLPFLLSLKEIIF